MAAIAQEQLESVARSMYHLSFESDALARRVVIGSPEDHAALESPQHFTMVYSTPNDPEAPLLYQADFAGDGASANESALAHGVNANLLMAQAPNFNERIIRNFALAIEFARDAHRLASTLPDAVQVLGLLAASTYDEPPHHLAIAVGSTPLLETVGSQFLDRVSGGQSRADLLNKLKADDESSQNLLKELYRGDGGFMGTGMGFTEYKGWYLKNMLEREEAGELPDDVDVAARTMAPLLMLPHEFTRPVVTQTFFR